MRGRGDEGMRGSGGPAPAALSGEDSGERRTLSQLRRAGRGFSWAASPPSQVECPPCPAAPRACRASGERPHSRERHCQRRWPSFNAPSSPLAVGALAAPRASFSAHVERSSRPVVAIAAAVALSPTGARPNGHPEAGEHSTPPLRLPSPSTNSHHRLLHSTPPTHTHFRYTEATQQIDALGTAPPHHPGYPPDHSLLPLARLSLVRFLPFSCPSSLSSLSPSSLSPSSLSLCLLCLLR